MNSFKRIGVLTSGGDAPGMNAAVRAITRKALAEGVDVMGIMGGYSGLIHDNMIHLTTTSVSNTIKAGGTILYSDRCLEFKTEEGMQKAIETCKRRGIDAIVAIGGDGTFRGATDLTLHGIPTIGVPATIDNDITASDYTIGFDTAMNTTLSVMDRLRDTCESHARCNIVEVMGRGCGDIALHTAIACGAAFVAIPEVAFDESNAIQSVLRAKANGKRGILAVVSEGVFYKGENGEQIPCGEVLQKTIEEKTGVETKFARLAHIVRGGSPTLRDRVTATRMGIKAVELLLKGKSNLVVVEFDGEITSMDIVFALTTDRIYKGTLQHGDLDNFTTADVDKMREICARREKDILTLHKSLTDIQMS